jgi:hypothetical protein
VRSAHPSVQNSSSSAQGQLSTHTELAFVTNSASAAALAQLNANSGASRLQAATAVLGAMIGGVAMVALA